MSLHLHSYFVYASIIWAMTSDFQQWGILTSVDTDEPVSLLLNLEIPNVVSQGIFKRQAKALIRLFVCACRSDGFLFAHTTLLEISCHGSIMHRLVWSFDNAISTKMRWPLLPFTIVINPAWFIWPAVPTFARNSCFVVCGSSKKFSCDFKWCSAAR